VAVLLIAAVTLAAYWPALGGEFLIWDDNQLLLHNPDYRGLGWTQLAWMATAHPLGHWVPLTWLSYAVDHALWGMNPVGYHLTNLTLHVLGALLVRRLALALLPRATALRGSVLHAAALMAALVFALHPLRVESVAWLTARRDVLSGVLFFTTVLAYLHAVDARGPQRRGWLAAAAGSFGLALLAKSSVVALPALLVLLDVYPLRRVPAHPREWLASPYRTVWLEKLPFVGLATAAAVVALQINVGHVLYLSPGEQLAKLAVTAWFHVHRFLLPIALSPLYELPPRLALAEPHVLVAGLGALAITVLALAGRDRFPAGLALWAGFMLMLLPMTGAVQVGPQLTADRYHYLAGVSWALLAGAGAGTAWRAWQAGGATRRAGGLGLALVAVWLAALGLATWRQAHAWQTTEALWTQAVTATPDCSYCRRQLGIWLMVQGRAAEGLDQLELAAVLRPDVHMAHGLVGQAYERVGHFDRAVLAYRRELARRPWAVEARDGLGRALLRAGRPEEARVELARAVEQAPGILALRVTLGLAWLELGRPAEAVRELGPAVRGRPRDAAARFALARAYLDLRQPELARDHYRALEALDPALAARLRPRLAGR
jgi:tetratricopeptide (TPR) repeat protein